MQNEKKMKCCNGFLCCACILQTIATARRTYALIRISTPKPLCLKSQPSANVTYFAGRIHPEFFQFLRPRWGAELRLLHGDTCGSSSGARALRPPGSRSGRNQACGSNGRRTLLNASTVGHYSHRTPTGPPAREIFALLSALFHKRRIRHGAHPYFQFLTVGPFSSARGLKWDRPIPLQFGEERGHKMQPFVAKFQGQM